MRSCKFKRVVFAVFCSVSRFKTSFSPMLFGLLLALGTDPSTSLHVSSFQVIPAPVLPGSGIRTLVPRNRALLFIQPHSIRLYTFYVVGNEEGGGGGSRGTATKRRIEGTKRVPPTDRFEYICFVYVLVRWL